MRSTADVVRDIVATFEVRGYAQVEGYNRFGYVRLTPHAVIVSREHGEDTLIPHDKIAQAIEAVRADPTVYDAGPSALRNHELTHLTSPLWSLLHVLSLAELTE